MGPLENLKHEAFCQALFTTNPPMNATEAYRKVYGKGKNDNTDYASASQILRNIKVKSRIEELQAETAKSAGITRDWIMEQLKLVYNRSLQPEELKEWDRAAKELIGTGEFVFDGKSANRSLELMGKEIGMFKEKIDMTVSHVLLNDLLDEEGENK